MGKEYENLGKRIAEKLSETGMSQKALAEHVGITSATMSRYIRGERTPRGPIIVAIAEALGCSTDELIGAEQSEETTTNEKAAPGIREVLDWFKTRIVETESAEEKEMFTVAVFLMEKQAEITWIPVKEALPEKEGEYLVTSRWDGEAPFGTEVLDYGFKTNARWEGTDRVFQNGASFGELWGDEMENLREVAAWMPIPKPFTGEE